MTTRTKLLHWLMENRRQWVSGERISNTLGISRTAVWKQINSLKAEGHHIESAPKKGYRLRKEADILDAHDIQARLRTRLMGRPALEVYQQTDSTNLQAKALAAAGAAEGTVVAADSQTHGRGRRGRTWFSPSGRSIYVSIVLRPPLSPAQAPQITLMTAVALAETLNAIAGVEAKIKWPNDLLIRGKKVAGILTEISTDMDVVDFVIVGLGINVNVAAEEMPEDIRAIATSIRIETGTEAYRPDLLSSFLMHFEKCYDRLTTEGFGPIMVKWRRMTDIIGQHVNVDLPNSRYSGTVQAVDDDGVLLLRDSRGEVHRIFSGDVTRVRPDGSLGGSV